MVQSFANNNEPTELRVGFLAVESRTLLRVLQVCSSGSRVMAARLEPDRLEDPTNRKEPLWFVDYAEPYRKLAIAMGSATAEDAVVVTTRTTYSGQEERRSF